MATWHKKVGRIHHQLYVYSGGWIGSNLATIPMLLLTTTGRKSGLPRTVPLAHLKDGETFVIVASNAGGTKDPLWWLNLKANPRCEVQAGRKRYWCEARLATPDERERLWKRLKRRIPFYGLYERKTDRHIPVVLLEH